MNRSIAEVFSPGEYIKDELEARGWTQSDLAEILGRSRPKINELINGKRAITIQTAKELAAAFGTSAQVWLNLETQWQLWRDRSTEDAVDRRAKLYALAPIKDLEKRGWIASSKNVDVVEQQVLDFFEIKSLDESPAWLKSAARQSTPYIAPNPAQAAWLYRVRQLAPAIHAEAFNSARLPGFIEGELQPLMANVEDVRAVPLRLAQVGIRFVLLQHLPRTKIDGATIWLTPDQPVIAVSTRYDRIDHFWFTLMHEIGHVKAGDGKERNWLLDNDLASSEGSPGEKPPFEVEADRFASEQLISSEDFEDFVNRVGPYYSDERVIGFARRLKIHPGIVAGRIHHRTGNFQQFRDYLVNVRQFLIQSAMTDGWGHQAA